MKLFFICLLLHIEILKAQISEIQAKNTVTQNVTQCGMLKCLNHALCTFDGKACQCRRGFVGETCKDDTNECERGTPCLHRGYCQNTFGGYRCDCLPGWANHDEKQPHCRDKTNPDINFRKCIPGWMGEMCQDKCLNSSMCGQNQVCKKNVTGLGCFCEDGWEGDSCITDVNECTKSPCKRFETCINNVGSFTCTCPAGWQGSNCSDDVNECSEKPCNNSGRCTNTDGSYLCDCTDGWTGFNCDEDVDECTTQPCNATLVCNNVPGSYSCEVPPTSEKADSGGLNTNVILVASLGALLLLILSIFLLITAKNKCKKNLERRRGRTAVLPEKQTFPGRNFDASPAIRQGFVYQQDKPVAKMQGLDF